MKGPDYSRIITGRPAQVAAGLVERDH